MAVKYLQLQQEIIDRFHIEICDGTLCGIDWHRTHAHVPLRRVCKWERRNSVLSTFTLLHEIGHIETSKSRMRRSEAEYFATVWALRCAADYGLVIPEHIIDRYQNYIFMEYGRGIRRGGKLPPRESFLLPRLEREVDDG